MVTKKRRLAVEADSTTTTARVSLTSLPIEILAEVLLYTCSPPTVLAVSRTCAFLYRSLFQNSSASFIWRGVRKTCSPLPLPDPGDGWKKSEADYAAFVFGGGVCEVCCKTTRAMYTSFSARIRLCGNWHCRAKFLEQCLVDVTTQVQGTDRRSIWIPSVESKRCFYPARVTASSWPNCDLMYRKRDWEDFQRDLLVYKDAEAARPQPNPATSPAVTTGEGDEQRELILKRCSAAKERITDIMDVSLRLIKWKWTYDQEFRVIKKCNDRWTKELAEREGWILEDLVASETYGSLQRCKTLLFEQIEPNDVTPIRATIESELVTFQARHDRQKAEGTYREKLTEVKKIYERMRCGTLEVAQAGSSGSNDPLILPPLSVFRTLPSVRALKGSPDPSALPPPVTSEMNSSLAMSLIKADIHTWLVPVQKHLMTVLGYPNGWQSASTRALHPLKRLTARFFCRKCGEGKVGKGSRREQCLDLKGVCSHVCVAAPGKRIEDGTGNGNEQEKGKGKSRKKSGNKMSDWKVDMFEKDEKAIRAIKTILDLADMSEETAILSRVHSTFKDKYDLRCMSCQGWIVMDFETAIGHARRHESMEIRLLPWTWVNHLGCSYTKLKSPLELLATFKRGNCELLLGPSYRAGRLCKDDNYGCKHCMIVDKDDKLVSVGKVGNQERKAMNFNALRSHVKDKHGIQDIRDEDFFCYKSIRNSSGGSGKG